MEAISMVLVTGRVRPQVKRVQEKKRKGREMMTRFISRLEGGESRDFIVKINPVMGFEGSRGLYLKNKQTNKNFLVHNNFFKLWLHLKITQEALEM